MEVAGFLLNTLILIAYLITMRKLVKVYLKKSDAQPVIKVEDETPVVAQVADALNIWSAQDLLKADKKLNRTKKPKKTKEMPLETSSIEFVGTVDLLDKHSENVYYGSVKLRAK